MPVRRPWLVRTEHDDAVTARFFVMATGCLSASKMPEIPGLDTVKGATYHTAHWPHEGVDFTGERVGLIGTGSSGVQSAPVIAEQAADEIAARKADWWRSPSRGSGPPGRSTPSTSSSTRPASTR